MDIDLELISIRSTNSENVTNLFVKKCSRAESMLAYSYSSTVFFIRNHNTHGKFFYSRDPHHQELSWFCYGTTIILKYEGLDGRSFFYNFLYKYSSYDVNICGQVLLPPLHFLTLFFPNSF